MARHAQIAQNNKFAISLQHGKKKVSDAVDFLHADKHERLLQIDTMIFLWGWSSIPKVSKIASLQCLYNISKKVRDKVDFLDADNIKVDTIIKVILSLLMGMNKHSQITQSNKLAISLQYLKKEVKNGVHFLHADKHYNFDKLDYRF